MKKTPENNIKSKRELLKLIPQTAVAFIISNEFLADLFPKPKFGEPIYFSRIDFVRPILEGKRIYERSKIKNFEEIFQRKYAEVTNKRNLERPLVFEIKNDLRAELSLGGEVLNLNIWIKAGVGRVEGADSDGFKTFHAFHFNIDKFGNARYIMTNEPLSKILFLQQIGKHVDKELDLDTQTLREKILSDRDFANKLNAYIIFYLIGMLEKF